MKFLQKYQSTFLKVGANLLFLIFCAVALFVSLRGMPGNPTPVELNTQSWKDNGPFELSPERGRYALMYSIVEDKSFSFSVDLARFTAPDLAYHPQKGYVSLFAPTVSFLVMPGYLIGKNFGIAQVGTFAIISLFALANVFLIRAIAIRLGANTVAATLGGFIFLFASPAFAYAVNLYQHHISTFLILSSVYLLIRYNNIFSLCIIWILYGLSLSVDYPNFFLMFPIAIAAVGRIFFVKKEETQTHIGFSLGKSFAVTSIILPLLFFGWSNFMSYGNPFQLAGGLSSVAEVGADGKPQSARQETQKPTKNEKEIEPPAPKKGQQTNIFSFFLNRNLMNGFYIHFFSPDRGILFYTPVMLFGILGIIFSIRKRIKTSYLLVAILSVNILLYSMWGDPWGGWAFGSRYLIPSYALLSIFLGMVLTQFKKSYLLLIIFFIVLSYSIAVNTLGAITSSRNPPQIQIAAMEEESGIKQEYTIVRNAQMLSTDYSKAFVFQEFMGKYISAWNYYYAITGFIIAIAAFLTVYLKVSKTKHREETHNEV